MSEFLFNPPEINLSTILEKIRKFQEDLANHRCPRPDCDNGSVYEGNDGTQTHHVDCEICVFDTKL
jgi:hypothetical protein